MIVILKLRDVFVQPNEGAVDPLTRVSLEPQVV